jgi:hypothetical protein
MIYGEAIAQLLTEKLDIALSARASESSGFRRQELGY